VFSYFLPPEIVPCLQLKLFDLKKDSQQAAAHFNKPKMPFINKRKATTEELNREAIAAQNLPGNARARFTTTVELHEYTGNGNGGVFNQPAMELLQRKNYDAQKVTEVS